MESSGNGVERLGKVDFVEVIGSKSGVALGALPLSCLIARPDALGAKDMKAFCQDSVFLAGAAAGAVQFGLREEQSGKKGH